MIKVNVNGKKDFLIEGSTLNGTEIMFDIIMANRNSFHIIKGNKSYNATLVSRSDENKSVVINVNGTDYEISISDKYDLLLQQLGINKTSATTIQNVRAPMPGLIININTAVGSKVLKGDLLLILEAMKMENAIKSPRDGKIKSVKVELKQAVEKNQVLIEFE